MTELSNELVLSKDMSPSRTFDFEAVFAEN
jgi:hypothetical protein